MHKKTKLDNGLRIVTQEMPKMQSVAIGVWIYVGGRHETKINKGISHYLEHLLFKGTKKYSCRQIKESIEGVGGSLNGFTSEEATCYLAKLPSRHLDLALDVLSDMVINPALAPLDIDKERTVILEEIKMYKDLPQSYVHDLLDDLLWPAQPLGLSVIGSMETVSKISQEDLSKYQKATYTPSNIVVSAAGLLGHDKFRKKVEKIFSGLESKNINTFPKAIENQNKPQLKVFPKDTEQTHLALGFHGLSRDDPKRHALALLHIILGANMSSRLFNEIREKRGLAYEIGTHLKRFQDTGAFIVHAGIDNRKVEETIKLILAELEKIKNELVSEDEFRRANDFYLGQLMLALEDTMDQMLWVGESTLMLDKVQTLSQITKELSRLKRQDILNIAKDIFQDKSLNLALIGPLKDKEKDISQILRLN